MKKITALLLSALLLLSLLAGCGEKPAASGEQNTAAGTDAGAPEAAANAFAPEGSVIFEKDGVKVTTAGLDLDPTSLDSDPIIWLDIENTGDKDVYLGVVDGSVNGIMAQVVLTDYYMEDGEYYGGSSDFSITVPAGESIRRSLGYYKNNAPGLNMDVLGQIEFSFTTAKDEYSWYDYVSEPVVIATGEETETVDITALGDVVLDNEKIKLVIGQQDYDDWFGPEVYVYAENKTERFVGITAETAEADGVSCDYIYYALPLAPGKMGAACMSFDGDMREMKGFEQLTVNFGLCEADSYDALDSSAAVPLDPVSVSYPPQVWGEYTNGGISLEIKPKINELITVEVPENDPDGKLFTVYETASREAADFDGAGWLFSIAKISAAELHERLGMEMSGQSAFAKDDEGNYYMYYHPTDVRYFRATNEEMERDEGQWTMLNDWAYELKYNLAEKNGLEYVNYGNSELDMLVARAAWGDNSGVTLSTTEFGPVPIAGVDGEKYADFVLQGCFEYAGPEVETPDGEYVVLNFPEDDVRVDFFVGDPSVARIVSGDTETLYQASWWDDFISYADAMRGWYYAAGEKAGVKSPDTSLDKFCGDWHEQIAGRAMISVEKSVAPGAAKIYARWPDSAAVSYEWELVAFLDEDGKLRYQNGHMTVTEYDENGDSWINDESYEESGYFYIGSAGELIWHDDTVEDSVNNEDVFVR